MEEKKNAKTEVWDDPDLDLERGARNAAKWAESAAGTDDEKAAAAYREAKHSFTP